MKDLPATRTRRTAEQRAAWHQAQANRARATAAKQARALDTRAHVLLASAILKWAQSPTLPDEEPRMAGLLHMVLEHLPAADHEIFRTWWRSRGYPVD